MELKGKEENKDEKPIRKLIRKSHKIKRYLMISGVKLIRSQVKGTHSADNKVMKFQNLAVTGKKLQSDLHKTITSRTTQKRSFWRGGRLIKHLYNTTTNQIWTFFAGF